MAFDRRQGLVPPERWPNEAEAELLSRLARGQVRTRPPFGLLLRTLPARCRAVRRSCQLVSGRVLRVWVASWRLLETVDGKAGQNRSRRDGRRLDRREVQRRASGVNEGRVQGDGLRCKTDVYMLRNINDVLSPTTFTSPPNSRPFSLARPPMIPDRSDLPLLVVRRQRCVFPSRGGSAGGIGHGEEVAVGIFFALVGRVVVARKGRFVESEPACARRV